MYATDLMTWKKKSFCGRARTVFATSLASSVSLACSRSNRAYREMSARIVPGDARFIARGVSHKSSLVSRATCSASASEDALAFAFAAASAGPGPGPGPPSGFF